MLTWVNISEKALLHNINLFKKLIGPTKKIMAVVKSNAYGHGMALVAKICDESRNVSMLAVASLDEALSLLNQGITKPILVLSFFEFKDISKLNQNKLNQIRLPLFDKNETKKLYQILKKEKLKAYVHLKIDTGTTRIGFFPNEIEDIANFLKNKKETISLEAIYTHFADSEENKELTLKQNNKLLKSEKLLNSFNFKNFYVHSACTAASVTCEPAQNSIIRLGIGLYGLSPTKIVGSHINNKTKSKLKPALSWYTKIIQIKTIKPKSTVGYRCTFKVKRETKVAIIPVGYYDGFDRKFSNNGSVSIRGTICPIIGRICMNLSMVDVTHIQNVKAGDTVILLEPKQKKLNADALAKRIDTINYEIVSRINPVIPRIKVF